QYRAPQRRHCASAEKAWSAPAVRPSAGLSIALARCCMPRTRRTSSGREDRMAGRVMRRRRRQQGVVRKRRRLKLRLKLRLRLRLRSKRKLKLVLMRRLARPNVEVLIGGVTTSQWMGMGFRLGSGKVGMRLGMRRGHPMRLIVLARGDEIEV
ncbi:hypothetical protein LTR28_008081, partial [Elasticomyces elasticus]